MARAVLNVKNFGAKGDGVTDDTLAFKNLIASIPNDQSEPDPRNAGPVMFIPQGEYLISEKLEIGPFCGLEIRGEGVSPADNALTNAGIFGDAVDPGLDGRR